MRAVNQPHVSPARSQREPRGTKLPVSQEIFDLHSEQAPDAFVLGLQYGPMADVIQFTRPWLPDLPSPPYVPKGAKGASPRIMNVDGGPRDAGTFRLPSPRSWLKAASAQVSGSPALRSPSRRCSTSLGFLKTTRHLYLSIVKPGLIRSTSAASALASSSCPDCE